MPIILPFSMVEDPPLVIADISVYNAHPTLTPPRYFDFQKYWDKGGRVIILRGGVANAGWDYQLTYNVEKCIEMGIHFMIYHYTKLWKNLDNQVAIFSDIVSYAQSTPLFLDQFLDIETNDGLSKTTFTGNAEKIVTRLHGSSGILPGIYTRAYFWNANTYRNDWAKHLKLWVAHHFTGMSPYVIPTARPYIPDDWADINNPEVPYLWQIDTHDDGISWGSTGDNEIDLSFFTRNGGTYSAFNSIWGTNIQPPTANPPPTPTEDWREMKVNSMSMRNKPLYQTDTLAGRGILNRKVEVIGENVNGYVPTRIWLWENSLKKV